MLSKENILDIYTLSSMQEAMFFQWQLDRASASYFEQQSYYLDGPVDVDVFQRSLSMLLSRHDVLRTVFVQKGTNRPLQIVLKEWKADFEFYDITGSSEQEEWLERRRRSDQEKLFDLGRDCLMRVCLVKIAIDNYALIWSHHHIIMDGWCMGLVIADFWTIYQHTAGKTSTLLPAPAQFGSYIKWLEMQDRAIAKNYWKTLLDGYDEAVSARKHGFAPESKKVSEWNKKLIVFPDDLTNTLPAFAKKHDISLSSLMQGLWGLLLAKQNDRNDVVFGHVDSGRTADVPGIAAMLGVFINTLPVRIRWESGDNFLDWLKQLQDASLEGASFSYIPLAEIQSQTMLRQNLLDHVLLFQNHWDPSNEKDRPENGITLRKGETFTQSSYNLLVAITPFPELQIEYYYNIAYYADPYLQTLTERLWLIARQVVADATILVDKISILSAQDEMHMANEGKATMDSLPATTTLQDGFREMARLYPQQTALRCGTESLSYAMLDQLSDRLADYLSSQYQLLPGEKVGLMVDRSMRHVVGMLGILKAGAAFLPIDPEYPADRIHFILADSSVRLLLTDSAYLFGLETYEGSVFVMDIQLDSLAGPGEDGATIHLPETRTGSPAYIIYTSGTTGQPKGAVIAHRGIHSLVLSMIRTYDLTSRDHWLQFASFSFDASIFEITLALLSGAQLTIASRACIGNTEKFAGWMKETGINMAILPPSFLAGLGQQPLPFLRVLFTGGEAADLRTAIYHSAFTRYVNAYGPTECSICVSTYEVGPADTEKHTLPIGRPVLNSAIYILDRAKLCQPKGVIGEIAVAGLSVGEGYWNRPALTAEKFISYPGVPGNRLYLTGDRGKWTDEGLLEIEGRVDDQIKIRGFRIEPAEISHVILGIDSIRRAYVTKVNNNRGEPLLIAIAERSAPELDDDVLVRQIKERCIGRLPDYMVPGVVLVWNEIPVTPNGKVDRQAVIRKWENRLSDHADAEQSESYSEVNRKLIGIWEQVLETSPIGLKDDFFELGGHSLIAGQILSRIHKEFGVRLELGQLFTHTTIDSLSALIPSSQESTFASIAALEKQQHYALSHAQKRLWLAEQLEKLEGAYNIPSAYYLEGACDLSSLEKAFQLLHVRHEILRTVFREVNGEPRQFILTASTVHPLIRHVDLRHDPQRENIALTMVNEDRTRPFDLGSGPLIRIWLIQLEDERHLLFVNMHHIISDGWSMSILTEEVQELYNSVSSGRTAGLKALDIQYKDYAGWQSGQMASGMSAHRTYWHGKAKGLTPLDLPTDLARPRLKTYRGAGYRSVIDPDTTRFIRNFAGENDLSLFMAVTGIVFLVLHGFTRQKDITIGTVSSGRDHESLESQIGYYLNTIFLRLQMEGNMPADTFLMNVRKECLESFSHDSYPFDSLVTEMDLRAGPGRSPVFDVLLVFQNAGRLANKGMQGLQVQPLTLSTTTSTYDLVLSFIESDELLISVDYNTDLFEKDTIVYLVDWISQLMASLPHNTRATVRELLEIEITNTHSKILSEQV